MKTIEELLRFSDITPSEEYAITEVFEDYEKQINTLKAENTRLLEEKAKLIERVDNAEKRVNFWLTHWNKLDMEFTEFKSSITSPE